MANTAVSHVKITNYVYGGSGDSKIGTEVIGIPLTGAVFSEVKSTDQKYPDGVNAKITYPSQPGAPVYYTNETVAQLCAQANGNISAS
jgi:hypothetical protein